MYVCLVCRLKFLAVGTLSDCLKIQFTGKSATGILRKAR